VIDLGQQALLAGLVERHVLCESLQRGGRIQILVAREQQPEVRAVAGQQHAVAVDDQAARRRGQAEVELVLDGELLEPLGLDELQIGQPRAERRQTQSRHAAQQDLPPMEQALAFVDIGKEDRRLAHRNLTSASSKRSIR
jgi:hypothetical protein